MNENEFPKPILKPEQGPKVPAGEKRPPTPEELTEYAALINSYEDTVEGPRLSKTECEQEIVELERLLTAFESTQPIAELYAIKNLATDLTAQNSLKREVAKQSLGDIVNSLNTLKDLGDISSGKYEELKTRYKYLSRAVGMINNGKVDHER